MVRCGTCCCLGEATTTSGGCGGGFVSRGSINLIGSPGDSCHLRNKWLEAQLCLADAPSGSGLGPSGR